MGQYAIIMLETPPSNFKNAIYVVMYSMLISPLYLLMFSCIFHILLQTNQFTNWNVWWETVETGCSQSHEGELKDYPNALEWGEFGKIFPFSECVFSPSSNVHCALKPGAPSGMRAISISIPTH